MRAWLIILWLGLTLCAGAVEIPADIARDYLEADTVLDEQPCDWREAVGSIFRPAVAGMKDAEQVALHLASHMTELTGVYYSTERRKPNMNALEALAEKKVSCTGQSILLVCALRSVGIPARAVCVRRWNHVPGNHTWAEAWVHGEWKMLEFNEKAFNTPWVMESVGLLDPTKPEQRVYAAAPSARTCIRYGPTTVHVVDVTARYMNLAQEWYASKLLPPGHKRIMVEVWPRPEAPLTLTLETAEGRQIATAPSPTKGDDMRRFASLNLPEQGRYYLRLQGQPQRTPVQATSCPAQLIRLTRPAP